MTRKQCCDQKINFMMALHKRESAMIMREISGILQRRHPVMWTALASNCKLANHNQKKTGRLRW
jgi:hypothetical protein